VLTFRPVPGSRTRAPSPPDRGVSVVPCPRQRPRGRHEHEAEPDDSGLRPLDEVARKSLAAGDHRDMSGGRFWVARALTDTLHDLHPHSTGEVACRLGAWVDMVGMAQWRDSGGVKRGELRASVRFLAARWNWNKSKVHRFLGELRKSGRIEVIPQTSARQPATIVLVNYDEHQKSVGHERYANETQNRTASETAETVEGVGRPPTERDSERDGACYANGTPVRTKKKVEEGIRPPTTTNARENLAAYLGEYSGAVDRLAASSDSHGPFALALFGLFGPHGTDAQTWGTTPEADRPRMLAQAMDAYAGEGSRFKSNYFRAFLARII